MSHPAGTSQKVAEFLAHSLFAESARGTGWLSLVVSSNSIVESTSEVLCTIVVQQAAAHPVEQVEAA